jgi:RNA polymerase sigma-70 factor (ECF subfamily)
MQQHQNLIHQLREKDSNAFSKLYDLYSGAIYGVILKICRSEAVAQEVLQDTFLTVWEKSHQYKEEKASFYTWLYRIARNKALNAIRNSDKSIIQNEDLSVYEAKEDKQEERNSIEIKGSLNHLKPHHKKAIELVFFRGYTHREAYTEMNVPLGTFKSYIRQALKQLKENYVKVTLIFLTLIHVLK